VPETVERLKGEPGCTGMNTSMRVEHIMGKKSSKDKLLEQKTNVMRLLEQAKIPYQHHSYAYTDAVSGQDVAAAMEQDPKQVFKTLVTIGKSGEHYVFVIPVDSELNLKKAADAVGDKSVEMIKSKELLPLTGYVHGGCSPIGMKKSFATVIHKSALELDTIIFSAGRIGYQVELTLDNLKKVISFSIADVAGFA